MGCPARFSIVLYFASAQLNHGQKLNSIAHLFSALKSDRNNNSNESTVIYVYFILNFVLFFCIELRATKPYLKKNNNSNNKWHNICIITIHNRRNDFRPFIVLMAFAFERQVYKNCVRA